MMVLIRGNSSVVEQDESTSVGDEHIRVAVFNSGFPRKLQSS